MTSINQQRIVHCRTVLVAKFRKRWLEIANFCGHLFPLEPWSDHAVTKVPLKCPLFAGNKSLAKMAHRSHKSAQAGKSYFSFNTHFQNPTEYERVYHTVHAPSSITSPNRFNSGHLLLHQEGQAARPSLHTLTSNIYPSHHASTSKFGPIIRLNTFCFYLFCFLTL